MKHVYFKAGRGRGGWRRWLALLKSPEQEKHAFSLFAEVSDERCAWSVPLQPCLQNMSTFPTWKKNNWRSQRADTELQLRTSAVNCMFEGWIWCWKKFSAAAGLLTALKRDYKHLEEVPRHHTEGFYWHLRSFCWSWRRCSDTFEIFEFGSFGSLDARLVWLLLLKDCAAHHCWCFCLLEFI